MSLKAKKRLAHCSFSRIQSSSSINTFRQCPRKYFYSYVRGLPQKPSIHLIRGKIAHKIVEDFFRLDINNVPLDNFEFNMKILLQDMLSRLWSESWDEFKALELSENEINGYLEETKRMIQYWFLHFMDDVKKEAKNIGFKEAFNKLKPVSEEHFISEEIGVQGYVDAIHKDKEGIRIIDYKTSKKDKISEDYRLQLAIYSLLYHEKYNVYPYKAGVFLFRHGERTIDVTEDLLEFGRKELESIHVMTSTEDINDYPKKPSVLCNWRSGCCDYYDICCKEN
ncbi:MAG: RecB family exonuclease [Candidatus Nanoarchaeia archaeon]